MICDHKWLALYRNMQVLSNLHLLVKASMSTAKNMLWWVGAVIVIVVIAIHKADRKRIKVWIRSSRSAVKHYFNFNANQSSNVCRKIVSPQPQPRSKYLYLTITTIVCLYMHKAFFYYNGSRIFSRENVWINFEDNLSWQSNWTSVK